MSVALQGFKVVTEFVFNADQAVAGADMLNKQVDKLSRGAEQAIDSVARLGISYAMSFSGATGGILGILSNAIKSSDKFKSTQIELANTMVSNHMKIDGSTASFNSSLIQSEFIMNKIVKKAREFKISPDQLAQQTKQFAAFLGESKLKGGVFDSAIELSRVSNKAAPALGVSNMQAQMGIQSGISGDLSKNTQFGRRLFMESGQKIKEETGINNLKEFNKSPIDKRIKAMIVGLDKLAGPMEVVAARADTLGARFNSLKDLFWGIGSILKPLGDVILPTLKKALDLVTNYLKNEGAEIVKQVAIFIKGFMKGPKEMLVGLLQLKELSNDLGTAIAVGGFAAFVANMGMLTTFLGGFALTSGIATFMTGIGAFFLKIPVIGVILKSLASMFTLNLTGGFVTGLKSAIFVMGRMAGFIGILLIPLQGLSKAFAQIKIDSAVAIANSISTVMKALNKMRFGFEKIMAPITDMIDGWSKLFYAMFSGTGAIDGAVGSMNLLATTINGLGDGVLTLYASFRATFPAIFSLLSSIPKMFHEMISSIASLSFSDIAKGNIFNDVKTNPLLEYMKVFEEDFSGTINKFRTPTLDAEGKAGNISGNTTYNDITMNNNFKEVLQPDRIAFTIQEQLEKSSANRTSANPARAAGKLARSF